MFRSINKLDGVLYHYSETNVMQFYEIHSELTLSVPS
jgi:hypothetical protein